MKTLIRIRGGVVPSAMRCLILAVTVRLSSGGCPPRQAEGWEHTARADLLSDYNEFSARCPHVAISLFPSYIQVDHDLSHASLFIGIFLEWIDPSLVVPDDKVKLGEKVKVNASQIWTPQLRSTVADNRLLTPSLLTSPVTEVDPYTGTVISFFTTIMRGICIPDPANWPRDLLYCHWLIQPMAGETFNLTQPISIAALAKHRATIRERIFGRSRPGQRMSSWNVVELDSSIQTFHHIRPVLVEAVLQRLPGQLEAEVVHPVCLVSALVPASVVLPPWSSERPALIATSFLLHASLLLSLPTLISDLAGDGTPRNLLLYRNSGVLLLLVTLVWLVSLRLASRRKPLAGWLRAWARAASVLRTPLLLPTTPAAPPPHTALAKQSHIFDEPSVGLSEVLDRITFMSVAAGYLALAVISLRE